MRVWVSYIEARLGTLPQLADGAQRRCGACVRNVRPTQGLCSVHGATTMNASCCACLAPTKVNVAPLLRRIHLSMQCALQAFVDMRHMRTR